MKRRFSIFLMILLLLAPINVVGLEKQGLTENMGNNVEYLDELSLDEKLEAEDVLVRFFDAQVLGDTGTIKTFLGGHLLKKREKLLNNPSYSDFLRKTYKNARLEIIAYERLKENTIQIDTIILMNEQETIQVNFILVKESLPSNSSLSYRIHSQKVIGR